jgi:hypothetical protein
MTAEFTPIVRSLLSPERACDLGPGRPNEMMRAKLQQLTPEQLFAPTKVRDVDAAKACLAGLWLYHDFLDQSHEISQEIATVEGSYWHGIMHRREPDYGNAAYWFRKVGRHPVFDTLGTAAHELATTDPSRIVMPSPWDPFWFIDFCEKCVRNKEPGDQLARLIQKREWELLFAHCYRKAVAA